jgi:hypothetical protein
LLNLPNSPKQFFGIGINLFGAMQFLTPAIRSYWSGQGGVKMRKRLVAGVSVAIGLMLAIGFSRAQSPTEVTLLFWTGPESEAMQKVLDGYNKGAGTKDGINVKQILFSRQGYFEKEETDLAAGSRSSRL